MLFLRPRVCATVQVEGGVLLGALMIEMAGSMFEKEGRSEDSAGEDSGRC